MHDTLAGLLVVLETSQEVEDLVISVGVELDLNTVLEVLQRMHQCLIGGVYLL